MGEPEACAGSTGDVCYSRLSYRELDRGVAQHLRPRRIATIAVGGWVADETIRRAIDMRDGAIKNSTILSFQGRSNAFPHHRL